MESPELITSKSNVDHSRSEKDILLEVRGLKTHISSARGIIRAVDGVDLTIRKGEVVGLAGESGCGKSMTALSIMGLLPESAKIEDGSIILESENLLDLSQDELADMRGNRISMIFQDPISYLNPVMKVGDQIAELMTHHQNKTRKEAKEDTIDLMADLQLPSPREKYDSYPYQLSGGMKQRILIAMAMALRPSLIIADEPTTELDLTTQAQILDLLKSLVTRFGFSMLLITHDLGIIADITDRVYIMYMGKVVETNDVFGLYGNPLHPYTKGLLEAVKSIDEFRDEFHTIPGSLPDPLSVPAGCRFHPRCVNAMAICREKEPPPIRVNHAITSCWLYSEQSGDMK